MPVETQREIAAERQAMKEAVWEKAGYLRVSYDGEPARKPQRIFSRLFDDVLSDVTAALYLLGVKSRGRVKDQQHSRERHLRRAA